MIERIDVLLPPANRIGYGVLPYFSRAFLKALQRCGVECRLLGSEDGPTPNLLGQILSDPPDCTLSFNGLLPDEQGNFFCDRIQIPHVACLVDSPNKFLSLIQTNLNVITCIDQAWAGFFRNLHHDAQFMPHAVDREFAGDLQQERRYDAVFMGTCLDIEESRSNWKEWFSPAVCSVMDAASEIALADQTTSYLEAFTHAMADRIESHGDVDPEQLNFSDVLDNLEFYIRGKDRLKLLFSIKDVKVDIFGVASGGTHGWDTYLKGAPSNLQFHGRLSYPEALEVTKQSRLVINSCPSIKEGAHERIFAGYMAGASVLSNDCPYIRSLFNEDEILLYRHTNYDNVNDQVVALLADESKRLDTVRETQKKVLANHTWDHRARVLLDHLEKILPS